ncbi:MAG: isoprenylcysteine carboxylmethyltransferase family protein [Melioribacteraceae bacterium]|nr:isoprenylcysteine carboxylmethyltransferase family protein [Melioribacteraceae bacterium]MCF8263749.1 isoprenylcysteine carboxylmethyltransferase family protein [Melioribacteraceae bacterium]MCF8412670.1 isoprenylcysteine carboxylmethyltransferase family protein [Melioribacteraceae bacterium]MCF8430984.1 isoprenylcysteine carboxylmethyltransferase family protein [Melioribacteraceae bacterium]
MDPVNIIFAVVFFLSFASNFNKSKKGLKKKNTLIENKSKSILQTLPLNVAAIVVLLQILGIFDIGRISNNWDLQILRLAFILVYVASSYYILIAQKTLGDNYHSELVIYRDDKLVTNGIYKFIRHPIYLFQLVADFAAGIVLLNFIILPVVIFIELPLFYMRAKEEEAMLSQHFKAGYNDYVKKSGFFSPKLRS